MNLNPLSLMPADTATRWSRGFAGWSASAVGTGNRTVIRFGAPLARPGVRHRVGLSANRLT